MHVELHNKFLLSYLKVQRFWVLGSKVQSSEVQGAAPPLARKAASLIEK
jgi:hypothetical protein